MIDRNLVISGQMKLVDDSLPREFRDGSMPPPGHVAHSLRKGVRPTDVDRGGFSHDPNHSTSGLRCQPLSTQVGLDSCPMSLGELLKERRNRLKMSQADVARMVPGLT